MYYAKSCSSNYVKWEYWTFSRWNDRFITKFSYYGGENIRIILACNTSHIFLPLIYKKVPTLKKYIVNIVDECIYKIQKDDISNIYLLASEGTIKSRVYTDILKK